MKQNQQRPLHELAAKRIQYWFRQDKISLHNTPKTHELSKQRTYHPVLIPKIATLSLSAQILLKKPKPGRTIHKRPDALCEGAVYSGYDSIRYHNPPRKESESTLSSARVAHCKLKEHTLASHKLKNQPKQQDLCPKKPTLVSLLNMIEDPPSKDLEWVQPKEERLFQIDRAIKSLF